MVEFEWARRHSHTIVIINFLWWWFNYHVVGTSIDLCLAVARPCRLTPNVTCSIWTESDLNLTEGKILTNLKPGLAWDCDFGLRLGLGLITSSRYATVNLKSRVRVTVTVSHWDESAARAAWTWLDRDGCWLQVTVAARLTIGLACHARAVNWQLSHCNQDVVHKIVQYIQNCAVKFWCCQHCQYCTFFSQNIAHLFCTIIKLHKTLHKVLHRIIDVFIAQSIDQFGTKYCSYFCTIVLCANVF